MAASAVEKNNSSNNSIDLAKQVIAIKEVCEINSFDP